VFKGSTLPGSIYVGVIYFYADTRFAIYVGVIYFYADAAF
jgi:hypothetical protein